MTDIQQARDVLAKRRAATTSRQGVGLPVTAAPDDAALIQLVVNPDLLDAIDALLEAAAFNIEQHALGYTHATVARALDIAAAVIAADERMSA